MATPTPGSGSSGPSAESGEEAGLPVGFCGCLHAGPADAVHVERFAEAGCAGLDSVELGVGEMGRCADRVGDVPAVHEHVPDVELFKGRAHGGGSVYDPTDTDAVGRLLFNVGRSTVYRAIERQRNEARRATAAVTSD